MLSDAPRDLLAPLFALRTLLRHRLTVVILVVLSMLLAQGGLYLQLRLGLPQTLEANAMVQMAALIPLELFLLPRLLLQADAQELGLPSNPQNGWQETFEARWTRMVAAKLLLGFASFLGLLMFIVPGVFIFLVFGWTPHRVLLRGESIPEAARGSLAMIRGAALRTFGMGLVILMCYFTAAGLAALVLTALLPQPTAHARLVHPLFWGMQAFSALIGLWMTLSFLALFQGTERYAIPSESDSEK